MGHRSISTNPDPEDLAMRATAVAITPQGWLTDVYLGDPDLGLTHLRTLIGCAAVRPILLGADLVMWVADIIDNPY